MKRPAASRRRGSGPAGDPARRSTPGRPTPSRWKAMLLPCLLMAVSLAAYLTVLSVELPFLKGPHGYALVEPDSFMRWRLVERALSGEGARIRHMDEDNASRGRLNEWTSPMTLLGTGAVKAAEIFPGMDRNKASTAAALGPVLGLLAFGFLAWAGWKAGGVPMAVGLAVVWPALEDVEHVSRFGYVDYHGLHLLLAVIVFGGILASRARPSAAWGAGLGAACALMMWSAATESALLVGPVFLLAFFETTGNRATPGAGGRQWRAWWMAGTACVCAAWLFEFWPAVFHARLEFLSAWHVGVWALMGAALELNAAPRFKNVQRAAILGGTALLALAGAWAFKGGTLHLHILQDPGFQRQAALTREFQPYLAGPVQAWVADLWSKFGLLPLGLVLAPFLLRRLERRERFIWISALVLSGFALWQKRFVLATLPPLVLTAWISARALWPNRRWLPVGVMALAALGPWLSAWNFVDWATNQDGDPMRGPHAEAIAMTEAAWCMGQGGDRPVVLAAGDWGGVLAGSDKVRVVGSQYWSNLEGMNAGFDAYATPDPEAFQRIVRERGIRYLLVPDPETLTGQVNNALWVHTGRWATTTAPIFSTALWQLATDPRTPELDCPALRAWRPGWRILILGP